MQQYSSHEKELALEIADALNDKEAITLYLSYAHKYNEAFLRKILLRVLSVPEHKIRRTRGALFTFLVGQHGAGNDHTWN